MDPATVYPLGGTITVDNEPPVAKSETARLVAVAYNTAKPDAKAKSNAYAFVKSDGSFELPPLPTGKYVMLFAQLGHNPRIGFFGPDTLKNLYNDPDVNSKKPEFLIEHQAPGKLDYTFNLSVAGETPPAAPGPKAFVGSGLAPARTEINEAPFRESNADEAAFGFRHSCFKVESRLHYSDKVCYSDDDR